MDRLDYCNLDDLYAMRDRIDEEIQKRKSELKRELIDKFLGAFEELKKANIQVFFQTWESDYIIEEDNFQFK